MAPKLFFSSAGSHCIQSKALSSGDYLQPEDLDPLDQAVATSWFSSNSTVERTLSRRTLLPLAESDRQYPSDRQPSHHASRFSHVSPPTPRTTLAPYIKIPPLPRRGWRESVPAFPWRLSRHPRIHQSGKSESISLGSLRLRRHAFETGESSIIRTLFRFPSARRQLIGTRIMHEAGGVDE